MWQKLCIEYECYGRTQAAIAFIDIDHVFEIIIDSVMSQIESLGFDLQKQRQAEAKSILFTCF